MTDQALIAQLLGALKEAKSALVAFKFIQGDGNAWEDDDETALAKMDAVIAAAEAREGGQEKLAEAVIAQMDNAFHLGQVMHEYASKSSARAMQKAEEADATFRQSRDRVRALLAKGG